MKTITGLKIGQMQVNFAGNLTENEFYQLSIDTENFWNKFKEFRNNFLSTNYPTINLN